MAYKAKVTQGDGRKSNNANTLGVSAGRRSGQGKEGLSPSPGGRGSGGGAGVHSKMCAG